MAQKIQVLLVDDLDGGEAEGTVRFGLDGVDYEIDLSAEHAEALRRALAPFIDVARRGPGAGRQQGRGGQRAGASGLDTTEVREWARAQGIDVKDRGRIPAKVVARFKAATGR
jgi:Lsr2